MIQRIYRRLVQDLLRDYPAVALLGPRQCGKTTLAKSFSGDYFDFENTRATTRIDARWDTLMSGKRLLVLDEAQCAPEIFPRLRGAIDADRKRNGRFLLLGSVSPALMTQVSESLAGRLALVELSPFILPELKVRQVDDLWLFGGYPDGGILQPKRYGRWQRGYLQTLATRDLPSWGLPAKPEVTQRFMNILAAVHGQAWNASRIGASLGVDYKTIQSYLDYLQGAFVIRRLYPYRSSITKRLIKTPKLFWRDSGLVHAMLGVRNFDHLLEQPWVGASWEGFVIEQTLNTLHATDRYCEPFYFRTSDNHELDMVLNFGGERWAVEIKLTSNPSRGDVRRLNKTADMIDAAHRVLICRIDKKIENDTTLVTNLSGWLKSLIA